MTPDLSLAFAVHSAPGVYALLLGSGISRAARIPTGWEVVLDLVRKLAVAEGENCEPDPAAWYLEKFGISPGYSQILNALARTPSERQQLLRSYFEPTEEERTDGAKAPTKAHRAVASLVASGHIRLILTTNFDRLMERALEDVGVAPIVISTVDQLEGAVPLAHMKCCVVKLHGDYLDARILNTPEELATYDPKMDKFLDRVFDEFGLIACGWSADWDDALRAAIERAPNRRYSTYFAVRGTASDKAAALLARRAGKIVPIGDADAFFEGLEQKVSSIEQFSKPHPLSISAAVAACKLYLSQPEQSRIKFADLIADESRRVVKELARDRFSNTSEAVSSASVTSRVRNYESICQTLVAIAFQIGRWGDAGSVQCLVEAERRLYSAKASQGVVIWMAFQGYPITLLTYAVMLGASFNTRCDVIAPLLTSPLDEGSRQEILVVDVAPPFRLLGDNPQAWGRLLEGKDRHHTPLNDWLCDYLLTQFGEDFSSRLDFERRFDWVEVILAMANHKLCPPVFNSAFHPPGCYGYRTANRERLVQGIKASLNSAAERSPYVTSRLFGDTVLEVEQAVGRFEDWASTLRGHWW